MKGNLFDKDYYRLINGMIVTKEPMGYCWNHLHKGYLTKNLVDSKECRKKNCRCLILNENHGYVIQLKQKKREKAERKAREKGLSFYEFEGVKYLIK
jgi:hypothetical protein